MNFNDLNSESWKDIPIYEGLYQVSNFGRIRSLPKQAKNQYYKGQILNQYLNKQGFYYVCFYKDKKYKKYTVLQLVAYNFIKKVDSFKKCRCFSHKNGDKSDNRVENILYDDNHEKITNCNESKCRKCGIIKPILEFGKRPDCDLYYRTCNECKKIQSKNYYHGNHEIILDNGKKYYIDNKDKCLAKHKQWYQKNKKEVNRKNTLKNKEREKIDINYKLRRKYKDRLYQSFARQNCSKNRRSSLTFIGCSIEDFRLHIEIQFKTWMNWGNYGKNGWNLGHIIPCELFDFTDENQVKKCFNYTNFCPENSIDNHTKQDILLDGKFARNLTSEEKLNLINQYFDENNHLKPEIKQQYIEKFYL